MGGEDALLMTETTLLESSIADMLKAIDTATALPASKNPLVLFAASDLRIPESAAGDRPSALVGYQKCDLRASCRACWREPEDARQPQIERSRRIALPKRDHALGGQ